MPEVGQCWNSKLGKRNFFYQCFNGYWDERNKRFQFGQHPDGWIWNEKEEFIDHGIGIMTKDIYDNLMLSTSKWLECFKGEAVDYLLKRHSPKTLRFLEQLKDLEFFKAILKVDKPTQRTQLQLQRCFILGEDEDDLPEVPIGRNDNKVGPSSMANDTV